MQAIDTNVLVYAEIISSRHHRRARQLLRELAEGAHPWAIPWPCLYEFLRVVTHPRVYHPPAPLPVVLTDLKAILESPSVVLLSETPRHFEVMDGVIRESGVTGNLIHDAHIAALCLEHGVAELLTGDRDFGRFPGLRIADPFEPPPQRE
ncbi:MAG: PIN domain-containing protein [Acidobacteria bacterium]|nr:PIN domain-containing protein [Acidobacteriota bacterium]